MSFDSLPDHSRLWLLALETAPGPAAEAELRQGLAGIIEPWRHKGQAYQGAFDLLHGQIIAVAEPTLAANPSGCAIDGMLRKLGRLAETLALKVVDPAETVLVRQGEAFRAIPKAQLAQALERGDLDGRASVVDLTLYSLGELRAGHLEAPLAATWIGRKFNVAAAV